MERWESINLDNFNGPLDVLLHMIKEKSINIMDVNLIELSNQYISYIKNFELIDIEIASEYLVMAAYLIELKSKFLIPKEIVEIDDNFEEDQRDELLKRLVEYHKIKEVAGYFKEKQTDFLDTFSKPKSIFKITKIDDDKLPLAPNNIDIDKFASVFLRIIEKNKLKNIKISTITTTEVSPEEIANDIKRLLENHNKVIWTLTELLEDRGYTIQMMVATFLAILDLAKQQILILRQLEDDIQVEKLDFVLGDK